MKLLSYKEIIGKTKEKVDEMMGSVRATRMRKQADFEMLKIDEKVMGVETKVQELCLEYPIDLEKILDALDDIAVLERRKEQYENIIVELFPEK